MITRTLTALCQAEELFPFCLSSEMYCSLNVHLISRKAEIILRSNHEYTVKLHNLQTFHR